jgi:hypothetical protein
MQKLEYKSEDLIPMVLMVLEMCQHHYCTVSIKFALKDQFPEQRGKIITDPISLPVVELMYKKGKGFTKMIINMIDLIIAVFVAIRTKYEINYDDYTLQPRLRKLIEAFYYPLSDYRFPLDGMNDDYDDAHYNECHEAYMLSLFNIIYALIDLVVKKGMRNRNDHTDYGFVLMQLSNLGIRLNYHRDRINAFVSSNHLVK